MKLFVDFSLVYLLNIKIKITISKQKNCGNFGLERLELVNTEENKNKSCNLL